MSLQLTILGKYGPYPKAGGATSSYLLEGEGKKILLDVGSGSLSRLQEYCALDDLDAIVLSHLHSDHCADMFILRYAPLSKKIPVYLPDMPALEYQTLGECAQFDLHPLNEKTEVDFGGLQFRFCGTIHPVECYAMRISAQDADFVYTGDARYEEKLTEFCRGANVLLCDSGFLSAKEDAGNLPHMYVKQAGLTAARARVGQLWLTHINPLYSEDELRGEACEEFSNTIVVREMERMTISSYTGDSGEASPERIR